MLNSECNLTCPYCYGPNADNRNKVDMPLDDIFAIIDFLHEEGIESIVISGGEPLIHPNIVAIIEYIYAYKIKIALQTNITRIDILKKIIDKISWIGIPLDGISNKINKVLRTQKEYHTYTLEALNLAQYYRCKGSLKIKIGTVLTPYNIGNNNINNIAKLLNQIQPDIWKLYQVRPRGRAKKDYMHLYTSSEIMKKIEAKIRKKYPKLNVYSSFSNDSTKAYAIIDPDSMLLVPENDNYIECGKLVYKQKVNKKNWNIMKKTISYDLYSKNIYKTFNNFQN